MLFGIPAHLAEWDHHVSHDDVREEHIEIREETTVKDLVSRLQELGQVLPMVVRRNERTDPFHAGIRLLPGDEVVYLLRN